MYQPDYYPDNEILLVGVTDIYRIRVSSTVLDNYEILIQKQVSQSISISLNISPWSEMKIAFVAIPR